jgi:uncharacterized membrane protein
MASRGNGRRQGNGGTRNGNAGRGGSRSGQGITTAARQSAASQPRSRQGGNGKPAQAASGGTTKSATTRTRPDAKAPGSGARSASAATAAASDRGGPVGRLLRSAWRPFGAMGGLPLATLVLSLYGLGASIYLTLAHFDSSVTLVCSDKGLINCAEVTTSAQSELFGHIPVAVLGLAFYLFMVAINSPWGWRLRHPYVHWVRFGSVIVGMCFVLYLIYAELIEIRAICLWCTSVHVATFLIFVLLVFYTTFSTTSPAAPRQR